MVYTLNNLMTPKELYDSINQNTTLIGINKVYELVRRKDFPALKIGGRYYIIKDKVDEWFSKQADKFWC